MEKWFDRMVNGGFLLVPVVIAIVVFVLTRLGCGQVSVEDEKVEPVVRAHAVSTGVWREGHVLVRLEQGSVSPLRGFKKGLRV